MAIPVVSWYDGNNSNQVLEWKAGTIDAGNKTDEFTVMVWNNRKGTKFNGDVSDMQNVLLTVKDKDGEDSGRLVEEGWVKTRNISIGETDTTPIGGEAVKSIFTNSSTTNDDGIWTPKVAPHVHADGEVDILGVWNDFSTDLEGITKAAGNHVSLGFILDIPEDGEAGYYEFKIRLIYQYI